MASGRRVELPQRPVSRGCDGAEYTLNPSFSVKANLSNVADKLYAESLHRGHYIPGAGRLLQVALTARF